MVSNDLSILTDHDPRRVSLHLSWSPNSFGFDAVFVPVKVDKAGPRHRHGFLSEAGKRPLAAGQEGALSLKHLPHGQLGMLGVRRALSAGD